MKINKTNEFIEVIGHYDNEVQCAKMTLLAELYAIEHREGYAKFPIECEDKLRLIDEKLEFPPPAHYGYYSVNVLGVNYSGEFGDGQSPVSYPFTPIIDHDSSLISFDSSTNKTSIRFTDVTRFLISISVDGNIVDSIKSLEYWTTADSTKRVINYVQSGLDKMPESDFSFTLNSASDTIYINIITEAPTPKISIDLTTLSGWSSLSDGQHTITVKAKATGYRDSEASEGVTVTKEASMPVKGQIINLNMDGTTRQYRVLNTSGSQAEVVAMFDPNTRCKFNGDEVNTYSGGDLDTYLNTTWYGGLTTTAKNAIVSKTLTQYQYSYNSSVYNTTTHASYADYSTKSVKASGLSRKVYALDVEDIENYFNHTFSTADIWELFWNVRTRPSSYTYPWLRSAYAGGSDRAWYVIGSGGCVIRDDADVYNAARPAFTVDLSKISWS